jgi:FkbM family methyltransferase
MPLTQIVLNFGNGDTSRFSFRDHSIGDKGVIQQVFVNRDYDLARLARAGDIVAEYDRILAAGRTPLIIDCGANIGASSVWFAKVFPRAAVAALEPEQHNFEILCLNCGDYPNIVPERAAISSKKETLYIENPGRGDWGFRTTERPVGDGVSTPACSIESVARQFPDADLFMVKIDIEGGEARLFESNYEWVQGTMVIIMELHDWMLPGTANSRNCLKALSEFNRDFIFAGENIFSIRNPPGRSCRIKYRSDRNG